MKIFLTGATGFLGLHVARVLGSRGHGLKALVRPGSATRGIQELGAELIVGELPQGASLAGVLSGCDAVVHVGGIVKSLRKEEFFRVNTEGTAYLVQQVLQADPRPQMFLHISTLAAVDPRRGGDYCLSSEPGPALSHYGESKRQAESALAPLRGKVRSQILRPPVLYGPGDRAFLPLFKMIARGVAPMYRRGKNQLSICYGPDTARAVADLLETPRSQDAVYCLDDGQVHTWRSLAEAIARVMGKQPRYLRLGDPLMYSAALTNQLWAKLRRRPDVFTVNKMREMRQNRWVCGYNRLNADTGWTPSTPIATGMEMTYQFYRREGWLR